jgi:TRAP-type mannitol/chloroaromatic compound transport system substrate-binding protein
MKKLLTILIGTIIACPFATVSAKEKKEIKIVSSWGREVPGLGTSAQRFAKSLSDMTDGRLNTEYFAANERVKAFDVFDEVASGKAQMYISAEYYWKGKHSGYNFFGSVPFGLTADEMDAWIRSGGGQALWDELAGNFKLKCLPLGNTGSQSGVWFKDEIHSPDDFNGLRMRMPGLGGEVFAQLGGTPALLPGGEIYPALASGAIDATEWVGPWNDTHMRFYEVAKYYYYPGFHEPGTMISLCMNKSWWEKLTPSDQKIIEAAAALEHVAMRAEYDAKNAEYLKILVDNHGVQLKHFNQEIYNAAAKASVEVMQEIIAGNDLATKIYESYTTARSDIGKWKQISDIEYSIQRNEALNIGKRP